MSVEIMSATFKAQIPDQEYEDKKGKKTTVKSSTLKLVLLALADHASDTGESVYPSIETIRLKTSIGSNSTVIAAIHGLENLGILTEVRKRPRGNIEYRITPSVISGLQPVQSTITPTVNESSLTINEPSVAVSKEETADTPRISVRAYDPDEVEKPQKRKNQKPNSRVNLLEPQTKGERILFGTLQAEIIKLHGPSWKGIPTRFPSFACKELFAECEARLNGGLSSAINAGIQKGIRKVDNLVRYVDAVKPKEQPNSGARVTA
jgi:hypothetical protein